MRIYDKYEGRWNKPSIQNHNLRRFKEEHFGEQGIHFIAAQWDRINWKNKKEGEAWNCQYDDYFNLIDRRIEG